MPRQTKFQEDWLSLTDPTGNKVSLWCLKGKDEFYCFCHFCQKDIAIGNSGKLQLFQHANSSKHKNATKEATDHSQTKLKMISTTSGDYGLCLDKKTSNSWNLSQEEKIISAEILYILHAAVNNISFSSFDGVMELFGRMFPKAEEIKEMKLSSRKVSYEISHGLGPYFLTQIRKSIENCSFFTLLFDETLNESNKKQLDIHVRFWNEELNVIQQSYVGSEMLFHATATDIDSAIMSCMQKVNLPVKKLLMLGSDGPNVNKSVFKIFDHRLKQEVGEGLVNVGTCNLHIVHNAFGEGLQLETFASIIDFLEDIDVWFRKYPSRKEDLLISSQSIDEEIDCGTLRYVSNRWLSVVPSCERILKMYAALKQHFLNDLVENKSNLVKNERYKRIRSVLKSSITPAYIHFLVSVGKIFDNFLLLLQSDKTLIHLLYDEISGIVRKLLFRFISMENLKTIKDEDLLEMPLKSIMERENLKYLDVGNEATKILSSIGESEKRCFKLDAQNFYFKVTSYLLKKLPLRNQLLKCIQVLHPVARKEPATKTIGVVKRLARMLARCVQPEEIDKILDEWRIYVSDDEIKEEWSVEKKSDGEVSVWKNIDLYWGNVLSLNEINIRKKRYFYLSKIVKAALCLSHGQAPVERGFSINKKMMHDRTRMAQATIIGLRLIKDSVKKENIAKTVITREMIKFYKEAHSKYKAELLENQSQENKQGQVKKVLKSVPKNTKDELLTLKDNVVSAHKLIEEGNKRLEAALKRKSFADVAAAQALIAAGNKKLKTK